jgi:iron(III) transport system permease protein
MPMNGGPLHAGAAPPDAKLLRLAPRRWTNAWRSSALIAILLAFLVVFALLPLLTVLQRSVYDAAGHFVGLANYQAFLSNPSSLRTLRNSLVVSTISTMSTVLIALLYAFAISRTGMRFKGVARGAALIPLLTPSMLSALALVQLFGNQGYLRMLLGDESIYGPIGIVIGFTFAHFPHVFIILSAAVAGADGHLYEAASALRAGRWRVFRTVTLPTIKYGLASAAIVSFTLCMTDFGVPKVIGGQYDVLATEIYKQVIGRQNFQAGAVVSIVLLTPAVLAFVIDRLLRRSASATLTARSVPMAPARGRLFDNVALLYCACVAIFLVAMIAVPGYTSFTKFWPYNLELSLRSYQFGRYAGGGWEAYFNSLEMALVTACVGTAMVFAGAYLSEKSGAPRLLKGIYRLAATLPIAVPGLVLGLSYIFFLNDRGNPLQVLYGSMTVLIVSTIVHYFTVSHLTSVTALRQLDDEFESVSDSLKASRLRMFFRVTVPVCFPAILDVSIYLFLNAMTTVSAAVFLYSSRTPLASVAVINMDDAGEFAAASAMAIVIVATCIVARCLHLAASQHLLRRTQAWKRTRND